MEEQQITRGKRILLADDEQIVRKCIHLLLRRDGHNVTQAQDGLEALALFREGEFDLVITDFMMPGLRGDELTVRIKRLAPSQPVVMVTATDDGFTNGENPVDAIVHKPFNLLELRRAIAEALSVSQTARS